MISTRERGTHVAGRVVAHVAVGKLDTVWADRSGYGRNTQKNKFYEQIINPLSPVCFFALH